MPCRKSKTRSSPPRWNRSAASRSSPPSPPTAKPSAWRKHCTPRARRTSSACSTHSGPCFVTEETAGPQAPAPFPPTWWRCTRRWGEVGAGTLATGEVPSRTEGFRFALLLNRQVNMSNPCILRRGGAGSKCIDRTSPFICITIYLNRTTCRMVSGVAAYAFGGGYRFNLFYRYSRKKFFKSLIQFLHLERLL